MQLVQKVQVTRGHHLPIYRCQTASQVSLFVGFLISWISLPTKTTKIGTPRKKVISQYLVLKSVGSQTYYIYFVNALQLDFLITYAHMLKSLPKR